MAGGGVCDRRISGHGHERGGGGDEPPEKSEIPATSHYVHPEGSESGAASSDQRIAKYKLLPPIGRLDAYTAHRPRQSSRTQ